MFLTKRMVALACFLSALMFSASLTALPSDRFTGELFWVAGSYCPAGSLAANGQTVAVSGSNSPYTVLSEVMSAGSFDSSSGQLTLPNLVGAGAVGGGTAQSGSTYNIGQSSSNYQTQICTECPPHKHSVSETLSLVTSTTAASDSEPSDAYLGVTSDDQYLSGVSAANTKMNAGSIVVSGTTWDNAATSSATTVTVDSEMPYIAMLPCIVYKGLYPQKSD